MTAKKTFQIVEITNLLNNSVVYKAKVDGATPRRVALGLAVIAALAAGTNLQGADLRGANLRGANLRGAYLQGADLQDADLQGANLWSADLRSADLRSADLRSANLRSADLQGADLRSAHLRSAHLQGANLRGAYLRSADLQGANLRGTDLRGALHVELALARTVIVSQGTLTVWKKCRDDVIVTLRIPEAAKRSSAHGRKCRAEYAEVIALSAGAEATAIHDGLTKYRVGETVHCDKWCDDRWQECAGGIHFYLTREEAEAHQ